MATLSLLKQKLTRRCVMNLALYCGAIWRRRENCNMDAQLQSLECTTAPKIFRRFYCLYDFWCAQTCSFRAVFGLPIRNLTMLSALYSDMRKNFVQVHIYVLGDKLQRWNIIKIFSLSIRSCAHKFFLQIFGLFAIFLDTCGGWTCFNTPYTVIRTLSLSQGNWAPAPQPFWVGDMLTSTRYETQQPICMVIKLDERTVFRRSITPPALAESFCDTNADTQSICSS